MSRKKCRRKVYALVNPILMAIEGAAVTDKACLDKLRLLELAAIDAFRIGRATKDDWKALADLLNLAETMATQGIGRGEVLPACEQAQEALERALDRHDATGKLGIDGPGLEALRELHEYHDLQRLSISRSQYEQMIRLTANRIRSWVGQRREIAG
jgi:hypothetical protein